MSITRVNETHCKTCLHKIDAHGTCDDNENIKPSPEDITICMYCGQLSIFDADLNLRAITETELQEFKKDQPDDYNTFMQYSKVIKTKNEKN